MTGEGAYRPQGLLRNAHVQSTLSSSPLRGRQVRRRAAALLRDSQPWLLDGGEGVRLQGFFNALVRSPQRHRAGRHSARRPLGLVVLLHGWEGSAASNYILGTATVLMQRGFEVLRLNFRDHGDSHHLNESLFHSCRLDEVVNAVADALDRIDTRPVFLCGFSLGGNFALRVTLRGQERGLDIRGTMAVSPVISPHQVLTALEQGIPLYGRYFERKWSRSLRRKEAHFPHRYELRDWFSLRGLRAQTGFLVDQFTEFPALDDYLHGYALTGDALAALTTPSTIITAADDPVVPVEDYRRLPQNPHLELLITEHGGHCGYLENWRMESWIERYIGERLELAAGGRSTSAADTGAFHHQRLPQA